MGRFELLTPIQTFLRELMTKLPKHLRRVLFVVSVAFPYFACATVEYYQEPAQQFSQHQSYTYNADIKPILNNKCIACHACYDAPCQLKLEAAEGVERGASKKPVYTAARLIDDEPTRLHIDALTTSEWRKKGFFSVIAPQNSLMLQMLELGAEYPVKPNSPLSDEYRIGIDRDNECPKPREFAQYKKANPTGGMPYGVTGLSAKEYQTLTTWLKEGAHIESVNKTLPANLRDQIEIWEAFLNDPKPRNQLVARYLYEHLFLAHLHFKDSSERYFFRLIRSYTPSPELIKPVNTVKPYGDPKGKVYYRLDLITDTIVHKTHIVYELSSERLERFKELFLAPEWDVKELPGYTYEYASNPFLTFKAIPAKSRYQFMLDNAEYFTRTFIRGPVCRGPIATDVIRDQFWIMFEDPEYDQYVNDLAYQEKVTEYLGLPGEKSDLLALGSGWLKYNKKRNTYIEKRQVQYRRAFPKGAALEHIWDGDQHNDNAFLTIFRHHNSATVEKGWLGKYPLTLWMLDYPLFERTYYELVVGFNVFGSVSHQAQTRIYFDLIRNGGETNFLRFMSPKQRNKVYDEWYSYSGLIKKFITYHDMDVTTPSAIEFKGKLPEKVQVINQVIKKHGQLIPSDNLNRCSEPCVIEGSPQITAIYQALAKISSAPANKLPGILQLPEVSFLRVNLPNQNYEVFTLFRNRAHSNVAFMLGEELRYEPEKDTVTVLKGPMSSYPNMIFQVSAEELSAFVNELVAMKNEKARKQLINRWGVRRSSPDFWTVFHSFREYLERTSPLQAGYHDLNRYKGW